MAARAGLLHLRRSPPGYFVPRRVAHSTAARNRTRPFSERGRRGMMGGSDRRGAASMDLKLEGKTAAVTGGSAGIGKAIALCLAREGVDVAICGRRMEPLEAAAAEIARKTGRKIVPLAADLTRTKEANAFIDGAAEALGGLDILVNNAGSAAGGVLESLSDDD